MKDKWIRKMLCIYNGILLHHIKNKTRLFLEMQMDLESVIQSEVSEREKLVC